MVEVFTKTEKYINDEEALLSNQRSSSTQKEKSRAIRNRNEAPGGRETGTDPHRGIEKTDNDPQRGKRTLKTA